MHTDTVIQKTIEYIENNLEQKLSLDDISEKVCYSKFHLNRLFAQTVGCTIHKYIQQRRITEAARKLVETDKPIVEIALEANYQSQQAFTNAFRQYYDRTPQIYRESGAFTLRRTRETFMYGGMAA